MKLEEYIDYLVEFLKDYLEKSHAKGYVVGLSGGIDSALVAALLKKAVGDKVHAIIIPIHSSKVDMDDAVTVAKALDLNYEMVDLSDTFDTMKNTIQGQYDEQNVLAYANTKVRLRMCLLYAVAQLKGCLVCGTDNADEYYTGYFTKFGDGAYDVLPTRYLVKGEVRKAAKLLGIPEQVITKAPTAGIIDNVTDEIEMGVSYDELDAYLLGKEIDPKSVEIIEKLHAKSEHKRNWAVMPKEYIR